MRRVLTLRIRSFRVLCLFVCFSALLSVHVVAGAGGVQPLPPVTDAGGRLGLCDVLPGGPQVGTTWAQLAAAAGARVNRWEFRWDRIEPRKGTWSFEADDQAVEASVSAGLSVEGILIGTPSWATALRQRPGNGLPRGLGLAPTDPKNLWAEYVRTTVLHYRGDISTWEIWNEPDISSFWSGSPDDYYRLLTVAYSVIKSADPTATVLMAGMVVPDLSFFTRVVTDAARDEARGVGPFDGAAWHAYGRAVLLYSNLLRVRSVLTSHGFGALPIWVTEDGFPASNPNGEARQAAYVLQTVALGLAGGASRILVYRASDDTGPKSWGLVSASGVPRMGYVAFQVAARLFAHAQAVTYKPGGGVQRFVVYRPDQRVTVLWTSSVSSSTVAMDAGAPTGTVVDWQGNETNATATGGQYRLSLPGAAYNSGVDPSGSVVGGPPVFLVESNQAHTSPGPVNYISALSGAQRRLVLFNGGSVTVTTQVASALNPREYETVTIPPKALQTVDLELLAGPGYTGPYSVSAPSAVTYAAASQSSLASTSVPATTWYAPGAASQLNVVNPSSSAATQTIEVYGSSAHPLWKSRLTVQARSTGQVTLPPSKQRRSAVVRSSSPVVLTSPSSVSPRLDTSWYFVQPGPGSVTLFNPDAHVAAIDVRYVGARTVTGQQLRLGPRRTYSVSTHAARAIVVTSSRPVSVGGRASPVVASAPASPSTLSTVTTAGPARRVVLFNPAAQRAHVSYTLVGRTTSVQQSVELRPSGLSTLVARQPTAPARTVVVRSDVPVVAVPTR